MTAPGLTAAVEGIAHNKGELFASFDVDAFEVPHGRDEIWRFTPLRRLRGLHDGSARATGSATITVSSRAGVEIAIDDNGSGVPEGERQVVFERFSRGSTASHSGWAAPVACDAA